MWGLRVKVAVRDQDSGYESLQFGECYGDEGGRHPQAAHGQRGAAGPVALRRERGRAEKDAAD